MQIYANYMGLCSFKIRQSPRNVSLDGNTNMTFSESVSKRPNLFGNDSYIFGQKHVSVSKVRCVEIVCVEGTGTRRVE